MTWRSVDPLAGPVVGEAALGGGPPEPLEQLAVEAPVERLDVERPFPCGVQAVEVADARLDQTGKREVGEDVDVRPVRVGGADVLDQRHALQDVAAVVAPVGAAVDDGQGQGRAAAEQEDGRHREQAVDGAGRLGEFGPAAGPVVEFDGQEQEGLDPAPVEPRRPEQAVLPGADFADLLVGDLKDDLDRAPGVEQRPPRLRQPGPGVEAVEELRDASHVFRALAAVAERAQQRRGAFAQRPPRRQAGQGLLHGVAHMVGGGHRVGGLYRSAAAAVHPAAAGDPHPDPPPARGRENNRATGGNRWRSSSLTEGRSEGGWSGRAAVAGRVPCGYHGQRNRRRHPPVDFLGSRTDRRP